MALADFRLQHPLRVRWAEVDPQGIVFNPNYLMYADVAITEYWREIGFAYPAGLLALGVDTVVVKATLEYKAPARFDELLTVGVRCGRIGRTSLRMLLEIVRQAQTLVTGEIVYVTVAGEPHRPTAIPAPLSEAIMRHEHTPPERERAP